MIVALFISIICHIFCFNNIELTFNNNLAEGSSEPSKIFFLGPILQKQGFHPQSTRKAECPINMLNIRTFTDILRTKSSSVYKLDSDFKKPPLINAFDNKIVYLKPPQAPNIKEAKSSIMFYPPIPYHFLLYFKDRQTAHMEAVFYISTQGKVAEIKRKISSGNPEVDLLIMRNLTHFLNACKSRFVLDSWQTVKVDLSP